MKQITSLLFILLYPYCYSYTNLLEILFLKSFYNNNYGYYWYWNDESIYGLIWNFSDDIYNINPCGDVWQGIGCSGSALDCSDPGFECHITEIFLDVYDITGPFPQGFENLTELTYLSLYNNYLSSTIPSSTYMLSKLNTIDVATNYLSGTIHDNFFNMTTLQVVYLGQNYFQGSISSNIGEMTDLVVFELEDNLFSQTIPSEIGSLAALRSLLMYENQVTGTIPVELGNCNQLLRLDLEQNSIQGAFVDFVRVLYFL